MEYKNYMKKMKLELEIRRSIFCEIINDMLKNKTYDDLDSHRKLELISVMKSYNKLINKYQS